MARILVVSSIPQEGRTLARMLRRDGHTLAVAATGTASRQDMAAHHPDLVVLQVPDPADALRSLCQHMGSEARRLPAIGIVTAEGEDGARAETHDVPGFLDLLPTPFTDETFLTRVDALLRIREVLCGTSPWRPVDDPRESADVKDMPLLRRLLRRLDRALHAPVPRRERPLDPYLEAAAALVDTVEGRDGLDPGHAARVTNHCATLALHLGMEPDESELLSWAASVHDIGKIAVSAELLAKPTLSDTDRRLVRLHARRGAELIRALTPYEQAAEWVLYHHERPDGGGYYGRKGDSIPMPARILTVAEVFDAMTSSRSGRLSVSPEQAAETLREGRGTAYDADCVDALTKAVRPRRATIPVSADPTPADLR